MKNMWLRVSLLLILPCGLITCKAKTADDLGGSDVLAVDNSIGADKGRCSVHVAPSMEKTFNETFDPFKRIVLTKTADGDKCVTQPSVFQGMEEMLLAAGCKPQRVLVSEDAPHTANSGLIRAIDRWTCSPNTSATFQEAVKGRPTSRLDNTIFTASFGAQPDGFEVITFDKVNQHHTYYTATRGPTGRKVYTFSGTSFHMTPAQESSKGFAGSHPCTDCHVGGALIMKELKFPWMNWNPEGPDFKNFEAAKQALAFGPEHTNRRGLQAASIESNTRESAKLLNAERIRKVKNNLPVRHPPHRAGPPQRHSLGVLLRPLFCERELNFENSGGPAPTTGSLQLLPSMFQSDILATLLGKRVSPPAVDAAAYLAMFQKNKLAVPASKGQGDILGNRPLIYTNKAIVDEDLIQQMVQTGFMEKEFAIAVLMVDFQNPIFSQRRCSMLQAVPGNAIARNTTGSQLSNFMMGNFRKTLPKELFEEVLNNFKLAKSNIAALQDRVKKFNDVCNDQNNSKRLTAKPEDVYTLLKARRQIAINARSTGSNMFVSPRNYAIEEFVHQIFPEGHALGQGQFGKTAAKVRLVEETCGLNRN
jgi:hypothetical protein